jgi:hypothetical protein
MALDMDTIVFVLTGFFILIAVFFLMLRFSSSKIVKKFATGDTQQQKNDEKLAKLSASVAQNSKDIEQIKKMLSEGRLSKVGPYDDVVAKPNNSTQAAIDAITKTIGK